MNIPLKLFNNPLYCICICFDGVVIAANALRPFNTYCTPPNLDIRAWICRLNSAQRPIFSGLRFFNEPEISDSGPSAQTLPEDLCSGFLRPEKIHRPQPGLNPRTLDLEASTLPRDHRGRLEASVWLLKIWNGQEYDMMIAYMLYEVRRYYIQSCNY